MKKIFGLKTLLGFLCIILIPLLPSVLIYKITCKRLQSWATIHSRALEIGSLINRKNLRTKKNNLLINQSRRADPLYLSKIFPKLKLRQKECRLLEDLLISGDLLDNPSLEERFLFLKQCNTLRLEILESSCSDLKKFQSNSVEMDEADVAGVLNILEKNGSDTPLFFLSDWNMKRQSSKNGSEHWEVNMQVIERNL